MTFDCFGTLVDWNGGFHAILQKFAGDRAQELVRAYHRYEPSLEAAEYLPYVDVTRIALERAAQSIDFALKPNDAGAIAREWGTLPVFEDTRPVLEALRADGWRLAILTNCDDALFAQTAKTLGVPFDEVVTAEQVRSYKPAPAHFAEFARRTNVDRDHWIHAACSWFHDIAPARRLGIRRIWIDRDRTGEDPSAAHRVLPDLRDLPQAARDMLAPAAS